MKRLNTAFDRAYEKFKRFCTEWDEPDNTVAHTKENNETEQLKEPVIVIAPQPKKSHFTIEELCASETARKYGIDNTPNYEVKRNLQLLIDNVLDPLRDAYGKPITVNSGYRCKRLNNLVGGVPTSQHLTGKAADITVGTNQGNKALFNLAMSLNLPFDQLIDEKGLSWVHISFDESRQRHQVLSL